MRITEFTLIEAGGIFKRSPADPPFSAVAGNTFGAKPGEKFNFVSVVTYPKSGAFASTQERDAAVDKAVGKDMVVNTNTPVSTTLAFAIATLTGEDGRPVKFLRYFNTISPNMYGRWKNDRLPGLQSELQGSRKRRAGLMAKDVLQGKNEFKNGKAFMSYIQSLPALPPEIKKGLAMMGQGKLPVFENSAENLAAIRDNLGEIIQALGLTYGLVGGDAELAKVNIFDAQTRWDQLAIKFPTSSIEGLVDFSLNKKDAVLGVSSKGGRGASGSMTNFNNAYNLLNTRERTNFKKRYPEAWQILEFNTKYKAKELPLRLALEYGIENIDENKINRILAMISSNERNPKKLTAWELAQVKSYNAGTSGNWNYGYWILAKIAKNVAAKFNSNPKNSQAFKYLLNKSSMMQCYTKANIDKQGNVIITAIDTKFPMVFTGIVQLTSDTRYKATSAEGTFTFRLRG